MTTKKATLGQVLQRIDAIEQKLDKILSAIKNGSDGRGLMTSDAVEEMTRLEMEIRQAEPRAEYEARLRAGGARTEAEKLDAETLK